MCSKRFSLRKLSEFKERAPFGALSEMELVMVNAVYSFNFVGLTAGK